MHRKQASTRNTKRALVMVAAAFCALTVFIVKARAQSAPEMPSAVNAPLQPLRSGISGEQLLKELDEHNELRKSALHDYADFRTYRLADWKGKVHAEEIGRMQFQAPDRKAFTVTSENGSGIIRHKALNPLIASEIEAAAGKTHHDSSITAANYSLELLGEQQIGPYHCFVAQAVPRRQDKYLFEGKLWIDVNDYAVVRIEGHPARRLSFWITHSDFVRQYQKIEGFWLPQRDETFLQVRIYGKKILTIEHEQYLVNATQKTGQSLIEEARSRATPENN